jgi:hypothetical protein
MFSIASGLTTTTGSDLVPVPVSTGACTAGWSTVVDASVVLARRRGSTSAVRAVAIHVGADAALRAGHVAGTRLPVASGRTAVDPVWFLDLVRTTAQRPDIHDASNIRIAIRLNLADAVKTGIREGGFRSCKKKH